MMPGGHNVKDPLPGIQGGFFGGVKCGAVLIPPSLPDAAKPKP